MNRALSAWLCLTLASLGFAAHGAAAEPARVRVPFTQTVLKNGLTVQLVEDHGAPVVAVNIAYNVGSRNERKGVTGFANLFEGPGGRRVGRVSSPPAYPPTLIPPTPAA